MELWVRNDTDLALCGCVQDWVVSHKRAGVQPVISNPSRQIMRLLEKAHIPELIGEEYITVRMADAVALCQVRPAAFLESCSAFSALLLLPAVPQSICWMVSELKDLPQPSFLAFFCCLSPLLKVAASTDAAPDAKAHMQRLALQHCLALFVSVWVGISL